MILKRKIAKAKQFILMKSPTSQNARLASTDEPISCHFHFLSHANSSKSSIECLKSKTVYKHYTRAICQFIMSSASFPYLIPIATELNFEAQDFIQYIREIQPLIRGKISGLRGLLMILIEDSPTIISYKKAFQRLAVIFIKYFAPYWISTREVKCKLDYLKFRHRLLKEIRDHSLLFLEHV